MFSNVLDAMMDADRGYSNVCSRFYTDRRGTTVIMETGTYQSCDGLVVTR